MIRRCSRSLRPRRRAKNPRAKAWKSIEAWSSAWAFFRSRMRWMRRKQSRAIVHMASGSRSPWIIHDSDVWFSEMVLLVQR